MPTWFFVCRGTQKNKLKRKQVRQKAQEINSIVVLMRKRFEMNFVLVMSTILVFQKYAYEM